MKFLFAFLLLVSTAFAQGVRPLPKFIQNLSPENYAIWSAWNNQQDKLKSEAASKLCPDPYSTVTNLEANIDRVDRNYDVSGRLYPSRFVNPDYVGPGPLIILNPFCRMPVENTEGTPDWGHIFVPTKDGVKSVAELLNTAGPVDPEVLLANTLAPYFGK